MNEKLINQNVSPVNENSKLAEELTTEQALEKEVSKYRGFELNPESKEVILREVKEGNASIESLVEEQVVKAQEDLIYNVMRKIFTNKVRNLTTGLSAFRGQIKSTLDEHGKCIKIDYSDFYRYRCEYLKSNMNKNIFLPLVFKVGVGCDTLASITDDFEERVSEGEYFDELHLKYELLKTDYKIAKRYNIFSSVSELALNNTKSLTKLDRAILDLLVIWKSQYLLEEFKNKYGFYVRLVAKSPTFMGMHLDSEILSAIRKTLDIDEAFKEWITEYQTMIIRSLASRVREYMDITSNSSYVKEMLGIANEQYNLKFDLDTLSKIRVDYIRHCSDMAYIGTIYNLESTDNLMQALDFVNNKLMSEGIVDEYSVISFMEDNIEDILDCANDFSIDFVRLLEGTFSCRYGTPQHNKFIERLLELKRDKYGKDFFTGENIELERDLYEYLFSDAYYEKVEPYSDLFRELERIKSRVIYNMLGGLKYGIKVKTTLNREMEGEQLQLLTELFKPILNVKHVSRKRMKAIAKSVSDVLGIDKVKVETLLDFRQEAITKGYIKHQTIVESVIEKIGAELTYEQFVLFINGIRNIMRRDNETDFIDYLERILERADTLEGVEIDDKLKVICSYKVDEPEISLLPLITEKVNRKVMELEKDKSFAHEIDCKGYIPFTNESKGYKVIVFNDAMQKTTGIQSSLGNLLIISKTEFKELLNDSKITEPCLSVEFDSKVSGIERETLIEKVTENNLRLRRRMN